MAYSRQNVDQSLYAGAPITTNLTLPDVVNAYAKGVKVVVDITAFTGTSITVTIQGKDPTSGKYYTILASAALAATGTTVLTVYPGLTAAANVTASDVLPRTWRVITSGTITSVTLTIGASEIV